MWRRAYLLLVAVRLYFALSPSYLHPDEHFQGPEVIANRIFNYPSSPTWEFTSSHPIRSAFPLWLVYGTPMYILRWLWQGFRHDEPPPWLTFYMLRGVMFTCSFVLEDWALHELVPVTKQRRLAIILVASSYVTWTWQTHTFSNSIETLLVLWCLVLVERVKGETRGSPQKRSRFAPLATFAFLLALGIFNRITFPAFVLVPTLQLIPHLRRRPWSLLFLIVVGALTALSAIVIDTNFYQPMSFDLYTLVQKPTITPLNNFLYNTVTENLSQHGLHPFYQHMLVNLPQFLGPAFPLLLLSPRLSTRLFSALVGCALLSLFPHQEARFLLPAVPLLLSSIRLPKRQTRTWIGVWIIFNGVLGLFMGVFHQGGVVPAQLHVGREWNGKIGTVIWWKTYPPPTWLLGSRQGQVSGNIETVNLMGAKTGVIIEAIAESVCEKESELTLVVAPRSAGVPALADLSNSLTPRAGSKDTGIMQTWSYYQHVNLDDLDWAQDSVWGTLGRVVREQGIAIYAVSATCN
ncbi:glycosyltransferase family 22 protein [Viridothelium virens]|uniref:Mannosyltransferase n=1 Tax=Viridothelium virens TaxID=1048519 RepID=A0A6A6H240_VIRVR|nr:glycosyltransferase family 22 protein [Viridothelium virens]